MAKQKKLKKPRNFVAKNMFLFNRPRVEEDKRDKEKHKNKDLNGSFSFC